MVLRWRIDFHYPPFHRVPHENCPIQLVDSIKELSVQNDSDDDWDIVQ